MTAKITIHSDKEMPCCLLEKKHIPYKIDDRCMYIDQKNEFIITKTLIANGYDFSISYTNN